MPEGAAPLAVMARGQSRHGLWKGQANSEGGVAAGGQGGPSLVGSAQEERTEGATLAQVNYAGVHLVAGGCRYCTVTPNSF